MIRSLHRNIRCEGNRCNLLGGTLSFRHLVADFAACGVQGCPVYLGPHGIARHQRVNHAGHARCAARRAGNGDHKHILMACCAHGYTSSAQRPVGNHYARIRKLSGGFALCAQCCAVAHKSFYGVEQHRRAHGRAHPRCAREAKRAAGEIYAGFQVSNYADGISGGEGSRAPHMGKDFILVYCNGNYPGDARRAARAHGEADYQHPIFRKGLNNHVSIGADELGICARQGFQLAVEYIHNHRGAHPGGGCAGNGHADHQHPYIRVGRDCNIAFCVKSSPVANACTGKGVCYQHADGRGNRGGAGRRRGYAAQNADQLILAVRCNGGFPRACDACAGENLRNRFGVGYNGCNGTPHCHSAAGNGNGKGRQQQIAIAGGANGRIPAGGNDRAFAKAGGDVVIHHNHVYGPAACPAARACGNGRGECDHHKVIFRAGGLVIALGGNVGPVSHQSLYYGIVLQGGKGEAHAHLGGGSGKGARDDPSGCVIRSLYHGVACNYQRDVFAQYCPGNSVVEYHRHGARHACLPARAAGNSPRYRLGIVIVGGEEVQKVDGVEHRIRADVDSDGVALVGYGGVLFNIDDAPGGGVPGGQIGGIGEQSIPTHGGNEILNGNSLLLCRKGEAPPLDMHPVAHKGFHGVFPIKQGEGSANAYLRALGYGEPARPKRQLALIKGADFDIGALERYAVCNLRPGHPMGHHNGDCPGNGGLCICAGNGARDSLRAQSAPVIPIHVLGQLRLHPQAGQILSFTACRHGGIRDHIGGHGGNSLVVIHANRHGGRNGVRACGKAHGRAGGPGAEVAVVIRKQQQIGRDQLARYGGQRLVVGYVHANRRRNLHGGSVGVGGLIAHAARHIAVGGGGGLAGGAIRRAGGARVLGTQGVGRSGQRIIGR